MFFIMANGKMVCVTEEANSIGLMVQFMRDIGSMIWLVVQVDSFILMGTFMKVCGKKIRRMEEEYICTGMEHLTQVNG